MQITKISFGSENGNSSGCKRAPGSVIEEFKKINSNEKLEKLDFSRIDFHEILIKSENQQEAEFLIFNQGLEIIEKNFKSFFIGGDHSISSSLIKAFLKLEENPFIVIFDAHPDCRKGKGNKSWIREIIGSGFDPGNILLISSRHFTDDEIDFVKKNKIIVIGMDLLREDISGICDLVMERARNSSGFYISIDINSVDPAFAPGNSYLEPGGLSSSELIYFLKRLRLLDNFRVCDIVEINPDLDHNNMTVKLGAKILAEII